jgi:hypothetical protein
MWLKHESGVIRGRSVYLASWPGHLDTHLAVHRRKPSILFECSRHVGHIHLELNLQSGMGEAGERMMRWPSTARWRRRRAIG